MWMRVILDFGDMLAIDLKGLGNRAGSAFRFLAQSIEEPLKLKGGQVYITSINAHAAKLLLHKFLRQQGLEDYRVVVTHPGLLQILEPRPEKKHRPSEKNAFVQNNETIGYYQAAAGWGDVPKPGRRKWKP